MSSIRFWTVSRGATILARFPGAGDSDRGDRMLQLAQKSLEIIPPGDVKRSYKVDTEAEQLIINDKLHKYTRHHHLDHYRH